PRRSQLLHARDRSGATHRRCNLRRRRSVALRLRSAQRGDAARLEHQRQRRLGARDASRVRVITGLAHTAVRVPDVDDAVAWYRDVLGFTVLSPPYRMEGEAITRDMGELVPAPVVVKAAIIGVDDGSDRVLEVIEYPGVRPGD